MAKKGRGDNIRDRRGNGNIWARIFTVFNLFSWVLILVILILLERAKPEFESFFDRCYHLDIRTCWDFEFVQYLLWLSMAGAVASSFGLILGVVRARRRDDPTRFGLVAMGLSSLAGICGIFFFLL